MSSHVRSLMLSLTMLCLAGAGHAATMTLSATDSGKHSSGGNHTISDQSYPVGWANEELRNFFVFDLSGLPVGETILSATLRAYNPAAGDAGTSSGDGYRSADAFEDYELREILLPASTVTAPSLNNTTVFNDLGDGPVFGTYSASAADNGQDIEIALNAAGIAYLQTLFGVGDAVLGGLVTSLDSVFGTEEAFWSETDPAGLGPYTRELVITFTPEPGTGVLLGMGLVAIATRRRRQRSA